MTTGFSVAGERLDGDRGVMVVAGEVDIATAPKMKECMVDLLESGVSRLVVDLSQVSFIDSTALGVLIGGVRRVNAAGGRMALVVGTPPVRRVLSLTGLDRVFTVHESREAALMALG